MNRCRKPLGRKKGHHIGAKGHNRRRDSGASPQWRSSQFCTGMAQGAVLENCAPPFEPKTKTDRMQSSANSMEFRLHPRRSDSFRGLNRHSRNSHWISRGCCTANERKVCITLPKAASSAPMGASWRLRRPSNNAGGGSRASQCTQHRAIDEFWRAIDDTFSNALQYRRCQAGPRHLHKRHVKAAIKVNASNRPASHDNHSAAAIGDECRGTRRVGDRLQCKSES